MTEFITSGPGRYRSAVVAAALIATSIATPAIARAQGRIDSASCVGCASPRHFRRAAAELLTFQLLPYTYNRWIVQAPTGQTTLHSWSANLRHGWVWDTDHFAVNQLAHPYSGNLYFNSARSNGYDFWSSAPFALAGSLLWEYFGETSRPSINDLLNTTFGGITLGETAYRLSNLILDRRAHGVTRVLREIGAGVVDPAFALSRFLNGDLGQQGENPVDRVPSRVGSEIHLGYQRVGPGSPESPLAEPNQAFVSYDLAYGDPLRGDVTHPFGAFRLEGTFATGTAGTVSELRATGYLATHDFQMEEVRAQELQLSLNYDYINNTAILSGGQGVSALLISRYYLGRALTLRTDASLLGYVINGVRSDFGGSAAAIANGTARNYDYGLGGGGRLYARLEHRGFDVLEGSYQGTWIGVVSGAAREHRYDILRGRLELPIFNRYALGASALLYTRTSEYATHPTVHARDAQTQAFVAVTF